MGKSKDKPQNVSDLTLLQPPTEDNITATLKLRFQNDIIYTSINDSVLVVVNPCKEMSQSQESLQYVAEYKDTSARDIEPVVPHVFRLINQAYLHMRRTGIDQSIILSGETGSGKSENCKLVLQHLVALSSQKKESKLQTQILNAQVVLEAFGHASTTMNPNASRFGKYIEVQFNERGRMIGAKTLNYLLEKKRVVRSPPGEQNFHVFYYLLAGATPEEKSVLRLDDATPFANLSRPHGAVNIADEEKFQSLKLALRSLGLGKRYQARIMQLLACLLHLGNLHFVDDTTIQEAAFVKNVDILELVADFLGVDPRALENVLTYKTQMIKKDVTTLILNAEQAALQRDQFIVALYSLLFTWIVEHINTKLCNDNIHNFIGILDMPGPHTYYSQASFDQFCVNFANERIHNYMLKQLFETDVSDHRFEGLEPKDVPYFNNSACIDLFTRPKHGLLDIANHYSRSSSRGKDSNLLDAFAKYNSTHDSFALKTTEGGAHRFAIQHFAGQVVYDPEGFVENNRDILSADFVSLIRGSGGLPESYNSFMLELFTGKGIHTESHPKETEAIMNAQQVNKPIRAPSMRRSKSKRRNKNAAVPDDSPPELPKEETKDDQKVSMALAQLQSSLDELIATLDETTPWFVFCLRSNDSHAPNMFDPQRVRAQVRALGLTQLAERLQMSFTTAFYHDEFCERYAQTLMAVGVEQDRLPRAQCEAAAAIFGWLGTQAAIGTSKIFLNESAWRHLEDGLRTVEKEEQRKLKEEKRVEGNMASLAPAGMAMGMGMGMTREQSADALSSVSFESGAGLLPTAQSEHSMGDRRNMAAASAAAAGLPLPQTMAHGGGSVYSDDQRSFMSDDDYYQDPPYHSYQDNDSHYGSEAFTASQSGTMEMKKMLPGNVEVEEPPEEEPLSATRKHWLRFVWVMTWWIPSKFLLMCGKMKRPDIQLAWREKVALCMIIFFISGCMILFLVGFGPLVCPHQDVFSNSELQAHSDDDNAYVAIRGEVFDLTKFAPHHWASEVIPGSAVLSYGGTDATDLFPVQVSALCEGVTGEVSPMVSLDFHINLTDSNAQYHDFRYSSGDYRPDWYYEKMVYLRKNYKLGTMGFARNDVYKQATSAVDIGGMKSTRKWAILNHNVYDLTYYLMGGRRAVAPEGETAPGDVNVDFMSDAVVNLFRTQSGNDITDYWNALDLDPVVKQRQEVCLRNLFYVGAVDERNSPKCVFAEYLLLIVTVFLCSVIVFKFLAALQFGTRRDPENHDKFIICQVPCYTEDEESLKKTIDSIASLKYDDKRKLLFIICDGMIIGGGNDRPTPRIVLDILGVDPNVDPEALSFFSIGEGAKQHNMGKVYSGLYEIHGHVVPYIVVVKVGKPSERQKPGNRGKRDSQLILMRFLNKVHFNSPMAPMELEVYHQIKNVIGVNPSFYEFVLMVDADTEVMPDGLNRMVSTLVHDSKIIGLCGETVLSNEKDTWVTMIQVYEYFISHYLIKAFESLFGSVTCLPGCFCIYRVRSPQKNQPLLISNQVIDDYQINRVDTLHKKNLLHLGEDRYLTTLILKHFPTYKTKFIADAKCATNAPDRWSVLLSQRRRWINSTIHNLGELVFLPQLCGFCCFSMRFVVMLDLLSTLVQPAIVGYLVYLIYTLATSTSGVPFMSIITIAGVYGLQMIIFLLHRKWEHIIWMIVSIFAIPVFSLYIPVYAYWHFDDFSWGNTRVVLGDKGKKLVMADEGKFDPKSIPTMTWEEYEEGLYNEDWNDNASQGSRGTARSGYSHGSYYSYGSYRSRQPTPGPGQYMPPSNMSYIAPTVQSYIPSNQSFIMPSNQSFISPGTPSYIAPMGQQSYMAPPGGQYRSPSPLHQRYNE
ncbi:chitin synthase-domain-containing protein [Radiomyces spectabilis]|uniref:chitin synthase-domain-containing protein n=1 Tax=Radiomyces spectabilis TaxID=64574 RepID=UPI00222102D1|nr:chitin synthase-domain-containing protein [Radiomyces spectabilis]KAI8384891.1 chitin synthase-domain-containing protein [Radiomyces spectabilis]